MCVCVYTYTHTSRDTSSAGDGNRFTLCSMHSFLYACMAIVLNQDILPPSQKWEPYVHVCVCVCVCVCMHTIKGDFIPSKEGEIAVCMYVDTFKCVCVYVCMYMYIYTSSLPQMAVYKKTQTILKYLCSDSFSYVYVCGGRICAHA